MIRGATTPSAFFLLALCTIANLVSGQYEHSSSLSAAAVSSQNYVRHEQPLVHHQHQPQHHEKVLFVPAHGHAEPSHHHGHAVSSQSFVSHHAPRQQHHHHEGASAGSPYSHEGHYNHDEDYNHHPAYKFEYSVHDDHTKDIKSQSESRDGDKVEGQYSLLQPDGHVRKVVYHADKHSGFNAQVSYSHQGHGYQQHHHQGY